MAGAAPGLLDEALHHRVLVREQLGGELRVDRRGDRRRAACPLDQRLRERRRHQEAHLLAVAPRGDVDADHAADLVERRPAAHAGVECAAEEDAGVEAALDEPVVVALEHGEADVERVAERVDAFALGQRVACGAEGERAARCIDHRAAVLARRAVRRQSLDERQVVDRVETQQLQGALAAVDAGVGQPVALGLQRHLADDVVVGDDQAVVTDEEARADRGLAVLALQQRAHLQQLAARAFVEALRGRRHGQRRGGDRRRHDPGRWVGGRGGCGGGRLRDDGAAHQRDQQPECTLPPGSGSCHGTDSGR